MYTGVNFLKERNRMQELILLRDKKIAQITSIVLGVFLFVVVALLAFQFYLQARLNSVKAQEASEQQVIQGLASIQNTYVGVSKKVKTVEEIFNKRSNKWDAITFFYRILPAGASINSVDLQSQNVTNQLSFSIQAPSVFVYDQLSQVIQSDAVKKSGYDLSLGALSRSKDGSYRIEMVLKSVTTTTTKATKPKS